MAERFCLDLGQKETHIVDREKVFGTTLVTPTFVCSMFCQGDLVLVIFPLASNRTSTQVGAVKSDKPLLSVGL